MAAPAEEAVVSSVALNSAVNESHGFDDEDAIMPEEDIMDHETFGETFTTMTAQMDEYRRTGKMPALSSTKQRNRSEGSEMDRKKVRAERRHAQRSKEAEAEVIVEGTKPAEPRHLVEPASPMNSATKNKARRAKQRSREAGSNASPEATSPGAASPAGASPAASPPPKHETSPMSPMGGGGQSAKNKARRDKYRSKTEGGASSPAGASPAAAAPAAAAADPPKHEMAPMSPMSASQRNIARRQKQRASEASGAANASVGGSSPEARAAAAACCDSDEEASAAPAGYAGPGQSKNTWNLRTQVPGESAEIYMRNKARRDNYRCKKDPTFVPSNAAKE